MRIFFIKRMYFLTTRPEIWKLFPIQEIFYVPAIANMIFLHSFKSGVVNPNRKTTRIAFGKAMETNPNFNGEPYRT